MKGSVPWLVVLVVPLIMFACGVAWGTVGRIAEAQQDAMAANRVKVTRAYSTHNTTPNHTMNHNHEQDDSPSMLAKKGLLELQQSESFELLAKSFNTSRNAVAKFLEKEPSLLYHSNIPCQNYSNNNKSPHRKLHAVLLGGSTAAKPTINCTLTAEKDPSEGRYSNLLEFKLRALGWDATVDNMAHGATTSIFSGMVLDQLLNVTDDRVDVIIWHSSINDFAPTSIGDPAQMLHFWLQRVRILYAQAHRRPPRILLLYLWKYHIGSWSAERILEESVGYELQASRSVVEEYANMGLPISVLNIGHMLTPELFIERKRQLLDDVHHPGCMGSHLIADLLQYTISTNILMENHPEHTAACQASSLAPTDKSLTATVTATTPKSFPFNTTIQQSEIPAYNRGNISELLVHPQATFGTYLIWRGPKLPRVASSLTVLLSPEESKDLSDLPRKNVSDIVTPGRLDSKDGFVIPLCESGDKLNLTIASSALSWDWLCIAFTGLSISLTINDGPATILPGKGAKVTLLGNVINMVRKRGAFDWIELPHAEGSVSSEIRLSFCDGDTKPTSTALLHFITGLSMDDA